MSSIPPIRFLWPQAAPAIEAGGDALPSMDAEQGKARRRHQLQMLQQAAEVRVMKKVTARARRTFTQNSPLS